MSNRAESPSRPSSSSSSSSSFSLFSHLPRLLNLSVSPPSPDPRGATAAEAVALMVSGGNDAKEKAAKRLFKLAWRDEKPAEVVQAGAVPHLVSYLGPLTRVSLKVRALKVLRALAYYEPAHRTLIMEAGAVKPLSKLLSVKAQAVSVNAALTLGYLAKDHQNRQAIAAAGVPQLLLKIVVETDPNIRETERVYARALNALYFLALDEEIAKGLANERTLEMLRAKIKASDDLYLKMFAAMVLSNLVVDPAALGMLEVGYDVIEVMRLFLEEGLRGDDKSILSLGDIARGLQKLSALPQNNQLITKSRIIFFLMKMLHSPKLDDDGKRLAEEALGSLSRVKEHRQRISALNGVNVFAFRMYGVIQNIIYFRLECPPHLVNTPESNFVQIMRRLPPELRDIICFLYAESFFKD